MWNLLDGPQGWTWVALTGNAVAAVVTAVRAAPTHGRLGREGPDPGLVRSLLVADGGPVETYCTDVAEDGSGRGGFVYVHRLRKGVNRQSHALKVARLAGMPPSVIAMAREVLVEEESRVQ